ncbi:retrovirus-related pol polyprotein from transposon TNT 1-94 [Tanacetum coccineum]
MAAINDGQRWRYTAGAPTDHQSTVVDSQLTGGVRSGNGPDADHAGRQDTRRSTSGNAQFLGDKLVSWSSKKQKSTALSITKAEYIAMSGCCA